MDTFIEYLNPADWSLHLVNVDNDAAGEDWIKVPEGAIEARLNGSGSLNFINKDGDFSNRATKGEWVGTHRGKHGCHDLVWKRHTQPEELPFIDDEIIVGDLVYSSVGDDEPIDNVNHPSHYTQGDIECIDAIKASMSHEAYCGYLKGNVQKYMWRYEHKDGVESLKKAQWYLDKLIVERSQ